MKRHMTKGILSFVLGTAFILSVITPAHTAIPHKINYQGYLTDPQGTAIDGSVSIVFSIYSQSSGSTALWTETQSVTVTDGVFSVNLGNVNSIDLPFDTQYYLGIKVGSDKEMTPRQPLTTAGYAFRAKEADSVKDNAVTTKVIANDAVTTDKVVDDAISEAKIAPGAVGSTAIANGAVSSSQIGDASIATGDLADDAVTAAKIKPAIVSSIDGVTNDGGNVDLVAGSNVTITPDDSANKITIASTGGGGSGDITAVYTGQGLSGGGDSGDVNLWIEPPFSMTGDTSASGSVISGTNNEGTGVYGESYTGTGVKGESSSGNGIYGKHRASGNHGSLGNSDSGVYGESATGYAVYGKTTSAATGVYGQSASGTGVYGWSNSDTGVYGLNYGSSNYGSLGSSTSGVYGYHGQTGNYGSIGGEYGGVHGESTSGWAVYGISNNGRGVYGSSVSSRGVYGKSRYDHGVYGESDSGNGVHGTTIGSGNGVYGTSTSGSGVYGYGPNGIGVYGTGLSSGVSGVSSTGIGVYGQTSDDGSNAVEGHNTYYASMGSLGGVNGGVYGFGSSTYAGYFSGSVHVSGTFSKSSGSFKIDHPLDPENKYLQHSFVESPDMMNVYNGNVFLDENGEAWVELPEWFEALNREFRYQLTPIGAPGPNLYIAQEISENQFKIAGGSQGMKVSWQVTGVRQDPYAKAHPIQVEKVKPPEEQGYYLHPDVYGQPEEKSIEWARDPEMMKKRKVQTEKKTQSNS